MAKTTEKSTLAAEFSDLTGFQRDALAILARDGPAYGLAIKRALEDVYEQEVNHGQLYPNLNTLVEAGYVEKSQRDKRTNEYKLADAGYELLEQHQIWLTACLDGE
ncbi:PadR family transcriptional regulator [Haladaptatus halobius]|uniref:PadR family transcriptional regulator n=1 Tax=Haladaptatus halobius TaxID=2884875 RepID=UPI001D0B0F29|nr:helix-turn-helix transcriptional regulator [Haladaptatus halobius]